MKERLQIGMLLICTYVVNVWRKNMDYHLPLTEEIIANNGITLKFIT